MNSETPRKVTALRGRARVGAYGGASKSGRQAVFLDTASDSYVLRRKSGPAMGDAELAQYVGHHIECDGFLIGTTFLADEIRILG
jgi:hypothetical protein